MSFYGTVADWDGRLVGVRDSGTGKWLLVRTVAYPDTCVGTDSHTTMINGLGAGGLSTTL